MHPLLERQMRHAGVDLESLAPAVRELLGAINEAYRHGDQDRRLIEQALENMSQELTESNRDLRQELEERRRAETALQGEKDEQAALIKQLGEAHEQLLQAEKMASIGQLAAGVAHEINNPVGYVHANLGSLARYMDDLFGLLGAADQAVAALPEDQPAAQAYREACRERDLDFLRQDVPSLLAESREGLARVRKIVQDLKDFSHPDGEILTWADLHQGLDSTLNIVHNEIKYHAQVEREYGDLPKIRCNPSQLNQVFLNLLVNGAHAIQSQGCAPGRLVIRTGREGPNWVWVEVGDSGCGITPDILPRIFDPFFTTKPVGQGSGLGLSLAYGIVQRHHGRIEVSTHPGQGTTFKVILPVDPLATQKGAEPSAANRLTSQPPADAIG